MNQLPAYLAVRGEDLELRVKAVPGARRDEIAGPLGDRLKIRVAQPPEGGRANDAIVALLAARLGIPVREILLVRGASAPLKEFAIAGAGSRASDVAAMLASGT